MHRGQKKPRALLAGAQASCEGSHSMDDDTLSALRTQLVRLIINQGTIFSNWIKFAITVQGALAAGLGFALSDAKYRVFGLTCSAENPAARAAAYLAPRFTTISAFAT